MNITTIKKKPLTEDGAYRILASTHMIGLLASMIKVEHQAQIFDTRFRLPNTSNHARKIVEASHQIGADTAVQFKLKNREQLDYEYAPEYLRLIQHFSEIGLERTIEFMDGVDKMKAAGELAIKEAQEAPIDYGLSEHKEKLDKLNKRPMEEFMLQKS